MVERIYSTSLTYYTHGKEFKICVDTRILDCVSVNGKKIAQDILLMYSAYGKHFVIYTDESKCQIGAVISQNEEFVVYFSRKFNHA